jgi:diacylglycerol kinase family enzyme
VNELLNSIVRLEGNVLKNSMLLHFRAEQLQVSSDVPLAWVLDGEFGGNVTNVFIEVKKQMVPLIIPNPLPQ